MTSNAVGRLVTVNFLLKIVEFARPALIALIKSFPFSFLDSPQIKYPPYTSIGSNFAIKVAAGKIWVLQRWNQR